MRMRRGGKGALIQKDVSATLSTSNMQTLFQPCIARCLPFDTTQITSKANGNNPQWGDPCHCLASAGHAPVVCMGEIVSFPWNAGGNAGGTAIQDGTSPTIRSTRSGEPAVAMKDEDCEFIVRKLMPTECERLQGFPDGWTDIEFKGKPASDTARYKALGNSMAVPVMRWIGERIERITQ